eukprot:5355781-Amphidinium_carterae.1
MGWLSATTVATATPILANKRVKPLTNFIALANANCGARQPRVSSNEHAMALQGWQLWRGGSLSRSSELSADLVVLMCMTRWQHCAWHWTKLRELRFLCYLVFTFHFEHEAVAQWRRARALGAFAS